MPASEILEILRCPITGAGLRQATADELAEFNRGVLARTLFHVDGNAVDLALEDGCIEDGGAYLYRIDAGVHSMLPSLAIALTDARPPDVQALEANKERVRRFYDEFGWQPAGQDDAVYNDGDVFEDHRAVARAYVAANHRRTRALLGSGRYLLDVASGPMQHPAHLAYSDGFERRVCVDLSMRALQGARAKLGAAASYVLGDITRLPLQDGAFSAALSLHTIYHVPAGEQAAAFEELYRVLEPRGRAVVAYTWGEACKAMQWTLAPRHLMGRLRRRLTGRQKMQHPFLYFHAHTLDWFEARDWPFDYELKSWRSLSVPFMRTYVHGPVGARFLSLIGRLEDTFPEAFGRYGQYPLFMMRKRP